MGEPEKGYVLRNADVKAGEASLHVYIGGGYTGALAKIDINLKSQML